MGIIHPRLMAHIARTHYPNTVTIQASTTAYNEANEPVLVWLNVDGLENLEAYIEPITNSQGAQEVRRPDQTIVQQAWAITIAGHYPTIKEAQRAIDDLGRIHNIIKANVDAFQTQTNLVTEIVNA